MFTFNPDMAHDDNLEDGDDAFDTTNLPKEEDGEDTDAMVTSIFSYSMIRPLATSLILLIVSRIESGRVGFSAMSVEGTGTRAPESREFCVTEQAIAEEEYLDEAAGGVPIDENLFADEDDLDDLEEDLEDLDVND